MKSKTLYIILSILVAGILSVFLVNSKNQETSSSDGYSFPVITNENVASIKIKSSEGEFEISKTAAGWTVGDKLADSLSVDSFLDSFIGIEVKGPYGTTEENYSRFSVDEANGIDLILNGNNGELLHIIIGKVGNDYMSTYFKLFDNKNVYTARSSWSSSVFKNADDWRDKTMWSFAAAEAKKIIAKQGGKTYEAVFDEETWSVKYAGITKSAELLASGATNMSAIGFTDDDIYMSDSLVFYGDSDAESLGYDVGSDDSFYYLTNASIDEKYKIAKSIFEQFWLPTVFAAAE